MWCVSFLGCINKVPQTRWLKQQKFMVSQIWSLSSQKSRCWQGQLSEGYEGESVSYFPLASDGLRGSLACR